MKVCSSCVCRPPISTLDIAYIWMNEWMKSVYRHTTYYVYHTSMEDQWKPRLYLVDTSNIFMYRLQY